MTGSTISTIISKEVVLGSGIYLNPLTVTSTGGISTPPGNTQTAGAIDVIVSAASITNDGVIRSAVPSSATATAPAILAVTELFLSNSGTLSGASGAYLEAGGTVTNSGFIAGLEAQGDGGYGVRLTNAALTNSGTIYGKRYGVTHLGSGEVINSGVISGKTAGIRLDYANQTISGTLINTGSIGGGIGITATNALITNAGTITAETYGICVSWGGSVTNSGYISAGGDGVLLLNQKYQASYQTNFTNAGTVQGNHYGIAIDFAIVTNAASGLITGTSFGAGVSYSGYLANAGNVYGSTVGLILTKGGSATNTGIVHGNTLGIELLADSAVTNAAGGSVYSINIGAWDETAQLVNAGVLQGDTYGLVMTSGGVASNTGIILSQFQGAYLSTLSSAASPNRLRNAGYIYGTKIGVNLQGGRVANAGTIGAHYIAVRVAANTSFNNTGTVYGGTYGVQIEGGTLLNAGSIDGGVDGVRASGAIVTNSGTLSGAKYALYGTGFVLTVDPGAIFNGDIVDKGMTSTLNLAGSTPGTLAGLGTQFNAFDAISFETGADWLISGTTVALAAQQAIDGFANGDTIIVTGFSSASDRYVSGKGLELINGSTIETLDITGGFTTADFSVSSSNMASSIRLEANAPCFAAGTAILTGRGEVCVESLTVGDIVITKTGKDMPVIWIGRRTLDLRRHPCPIAVLPICITANALAAGAPRRDLWVSPDHAMFIDDVLIPAQLLVNGLNIYRGAQAKVTYYHLELPEHAVIFAEHAAAETYLETGNRPAFANAGDSLILHPDFSATIRQQQSCAQLVVHGKKLDEIRDRILRRHQPGDRTLTQCRRFTAANR